MSNELLGQFIDFLDGAPTPWHAVQSVASRLDAHGFSPLDEGGFFEPVMAGTRFYLRRSGTLIAVHKGLRPTVDTGIRLVTAHTDSPNLRIKPQPLVRGKGWIRLGLEVYGGVIHATWTDRDLGLAGQVFLRDGRSALVDIRRPLCRIPNLAIHLNRTVNDEGLKLNAQTQLPAVFSLENATTAEDPLRALLAQELTCEEKDILTWDLCLFDLTKPTLGGLHDEFLFSARLDNLASCHAAVEALIAEIADEPPVSTQIVALFDHEEIGSTTSRGAQSRLLESVLEHVLAEEGPAALPRAVGNSWHLSADMAHAVHPAWPDKHEPQHMPELNKGPVLKQNANQRYGTEAETSAFVIRLAEAGGIPYQWFVNRTDLACGSTVGPLVGAQLGIRTVDVGNPMLSMHSAREMCGSQDQKWMVGLMRAFLAS